MSDRARTLLMYMYVYFSVRGLLTASLYISLYYIIHISENSYNSIRVLYILFCLNVLFVLIMTTE